MNPRALLCEILDVPPERAAPIIAGERDDHPEVSRALAAIERFTKAVREETLDQLWAAQ